MTRSILGVFGKPFLCLDSLLDLEPLAAVHEEITRGLAQIPVSYTGGSHRSLGIVPQHYAGAQYADYGEVIAQMNGAQREEFVALADEPVGLTAEDAERFGEERELDLSRRQMLLLKYRYQVYFPWQVFVELIPNHYWDNKSTHEGKQFTRLSRQFFPKTVQFVESLPFKTLGRCTLLGLDPNHDGTVHRDAEQTTDRAVDHFICVCPGPTKRLFLWDDVTQEKTQVKGRSYWFNDADYHGVEADPYFRYSIRVDGGFEEEFLQQIEQLSTAAPRHV